MATVLTPIVILPSKKLLDALERTSRSIKQTDKGKQILTSTSEESVGKVSQLSYRQPPALLSTADIKSNASYLGILHNKISETEAYRTLNDRYKLTTSLIEKAKELQLIDKKKGILADIKLDYETWDSKNIESTDVGYCVTSPSFGFIQVPDNITTVYNIASIINKLVIECLIKTLSNDSNNGIYTMFFASARASTLGYASGIKALRLVVTPPIYRIFRIVHSILLKGYKAENFYNSLKKSLKTAGFDTIDDQTNVFIYYLMQAMQYIYEQYQKDNSIRDFVSRTAMAAIILASLSSLDQEVDAEFNELVSSKNIVKDNYINYYIFEKTNTHSSDKEIYLYTAGVTFDNVVNEWETTHLNMVKEIHSVFANLYKAAHNSGDTNRRITISQVVYSITKAYPNLL